ncbi:hypothetical protein HWV62_26999 [Athelia sp. TMB]|nr:hypothetical protein HWV62_26999 [Athelia sp. TMB]
MVEVGGKEEDAMIGGHVRLCATRLTLYYFTSTTIVMRRYDSLEEELLQESSTLGHFDDDSGIAFPRNELEYDSRYPPFADYDQDDIEMSSPSPAERRIIHRSARAFGPPQISRLPNNALAQSQDYQDDIQDYDDSELSNLRLDGIFEDRRQPHYETASRSATRTLHDLQQTSYSSGQSPGASFS